MPTLKLRWSEDALREAYDTSEINVVRRGNDGTPGRRSILHGG